MTQDGDKPGHVRTVKEGEAHQIDGVLVTVWRKRRHGAQYRVEVRPLDPDTNAVDNREETAQ